MPPKILLAIGGHGFCDGSVVHPSMAGQAYGGASPMMVWETWRLFSGSWVKAQMGRTSLATRTHLTLRNRSLNKKFS